MHARAAPPPRAPRPTHTVVRLGLSHPAPAQAQRRAHALRSHGSASATGAFLGSQRPTRLTIDGAVVSPNTKVRDVLLRLGYREDDAGGGGGGGALLPPDPGAPPKVLVIASQGDCPRKRSDGGLATTLWEDEAFGHSRAMRDKLTKRRAQEKEQLAAAKAAEDQRLAEMEVAKHRKVVSMFFIDMDDETAATATLQREWPGLRLHDLLRTGEAAGDGPRIKQLLQDHFLDISDMFKHFSGGGGGSRTDEMDQNEWCQFALGMPFGMVNFARDAAKLQEIFRYAASMGAESGKDDSRTMTRMEFLEALLRLALWKYGREPNAPSRAGQLTPFSALEKLFMTFIIPGIRELGIGELRDVLKQADVRAVILESFRPLQKVFHNYCRAEFSEDAAGPTRGQSFGPMLLRRQLVAQPKANAATMSFREFVKTMVDSGFHEQSDGLRITVKDMRIAFAGSQSDDLEGVSAAVDLGSDSDEDTPGGAGGSGDVVDDDSDAESDAGQELDLREFVEAMCHLALHKYKRKTGMKAVEKVARVVRAVALLDAESVKAASHVRSGVSYMARAAAAPP